MSYYEVLLFVHIAAAVVWVGGGTALTIVGSRFARAADPQALKSLFDQSSWLSSRVFTPASLLVLVAGILLVIQGPWSFDQLWILVGLVGFGVSFVTGLFLLLPRAKAINTMMASDGPMPREAAELTRRLFVLTRIDYAVLFVVIAAMALKPTADDVWTLLVLAAAVAAAVVLVVRELHAEAPT